MGVDCIGKENTRYVRKKELNETGPRPGGRRVSCGLTRINARYVKKKDRLGVGGGGLRKVGSHGPNRRRREEELSMALRAGGGRAWPAAIEKEQKMDGAAVRQGETKWEGCINHQNREATKEEGEGRERTPEKRSVNMKGEGNKKRTLYTHTGR